MYTKLLYSYHLTRLHAGIACGPESEDPGHSPVVCISLVHVEITQFVESGEYPMDLQRSLASEWNFLKCTRLLPYVVILTYQINKPLHGPIDRRPFFGFMYVWFALACFKGYWVSIFGWSSLNVQQYLFHKIYVQKILKLLVRYLVRSVYYRRSIIVRIIPSHWSNSNQIPMILLILCKTPTTSKKVFYLSCQYKSIP